MIYEPFSVVVVPFPFTNLTKAKKRPALVISTEKFQKETGHVSLLMITTARHTQWFCDYQIQDSEKTGLKKNSCFVRQKLFTLDARIIEKTVGHLSKKDIAMIKTALKKCLSV